MNRMTEGKTHSHPSVFGQSLEYLAFIYMLKRRNVTKSNTMSASLLNQISQ